MSAGAARPHLARHSRAYWLPPGGTGNGFDAAAWAPIADLPELVAFQALGHLAGAGIAGYTAPRDGHRPQRPPVTYRLWVASDRFTAAADVLRVLMTAHPVDLPRSAPRSGADGGAFAVPMLAAMLTREVSS